MAIIAIGIYGAKRFIEHEKFQDEKIADLQYKLRVMERNTTRQVPTFLNLLRSYNYLAIGNSITKHSICEYWWNESGMAASREQNDYVHMIATRLGTDVEMYAFNFYI